MKTTEACPLKATLFKRPESAHKCLYSSCSTDTTIECCIYQFLVYLFDHCKDPDDLLSRLAQIIEREEHAPPH